MCEYHNNNINNNNRIYGKNVCCHDKGRRRERRGICNGICFSSPPPLPLTCISYLAGLPYKHTNTVQILYLFFFV